MRWIQYLKSLFICMWQKYKMFYALYFLKLLNVFGLSIVELVSQYHQLTSSLMITVCRWWRKNRQFLKISQKTGTWYVYNRLAFKTVDQNVQSLDIEQTVLNIIWRSSMVHYPLKTTWCRIRRLNFLQQFNKVFVLNTIWRTSMVHYPLKTTWCRIRRLNFLHEFNKVLHKTIYK